jgi:DNA-binding MarR family transcriptional regulator
MTSYPPETPPPAVDVEIAGHLRSVLGRLGRSLRLTHADQNLSPSQRDVLGTVVRRGPVGLSELASIEGLNPTMLSRIAAKLEGAGLIVRAPDRNDGRAASLAPTDAGRKMHQQIRTERTDALIVAMTQLSEDQRLELIAALPALESLNEALRRAPR